MRNRFILTVLLILSFIFNPLTIYGTSVMEMGDKGEDVVEMKQMLVDMGFASWNPPSPNYGSITANVVKGFQESYNLPVTGVVDQETYDRMLEIINPPYVIGDRGIQVVEIKEKLVDIDMASWDSPSPNYGPITADVVKEFQRIYALEPTGIVDEDTLSVLNSAVSGEITYAVGDEGQHIIEMKQMLVDMGFASWNPPSPRYGSITAAVVRDFQNFYGLPVTGVANESTRAKMSAIVNPPYREGDQGKQVVMVKNLLVDLTFASWNPPSPRYGSVTASVVRDFQREFNFEPTGVLTKKEIEYMRKILSPPYGVGDKGIPVIEMKEKLVELGYASWTNPSPNYGEITASVVRSFQKDYDLGITGIADEKTLDMINKAYNRFRLGDQGEHILELSNDLKALHFIQASQVTNQYDDVINKAINDFQLQYGLKQTGYADATTRDYMKRVLSPPFVNGDQGDPVIELKEKLVELEYANWNSPSPRYGSITETVVREFQKDYNLTVTGVVDQQTLSKIDEALKRYQLGGNHPVIKLLKEDLVMVGFANWSNPSQVFDEETKKSVERFQAHVGLPITGIANRETRERIREMIVPPYQVGDRGINVQLWKQKLVDLGFTSWNPPSINFGSNTETVVRRLQSYYGLRETGIIDSGTIKLINDILSGPYAPGNINSEVRLLKQKLSTLRYYDSLIDSIYDQAIMEAVEKFQKDQGLIVNGYADPVTLTEIDHKVSELKQRVIYRNYNVTFDKAVSYQLPTGRAKYDGAGKIDADEANIRYFMNPSNAKENTYWYVQFMRLDINSDLTAAEINRRFLSNKGTLTNTGSSFIKAGREHGVNEVYLIAHALHETGNGASTLARGVGVDSRGNIVYDKNGNVVSDINHKDVKHLVYNMYGYGAFDSNPLVGGVRYAYARGWFSPELAIIGGAKEISNNYISSHQNTLFKMKWDPDRAEQGGFGRQYATHIMWAEIQARMIFNVLGYEVFNPSVLFEVPSYLNQPSTQSSRPPAPSPSLPPSIVAETYPFGTKGQLSGNVNFRTGPSTNYESRGLVASGTEVKVIGKSSGSWYNVEVNGLNGWMHSDYVKLLNLYKVTTSSGSSLNYRDQPAGEVVGAVRSGELVALSLSASNRVVSEQKQLGNTMYNWLRVYVGQNEYWLADNFLTKY